MIGDIHLISTIQIKATSPAPINNLETRQVQEYSKCQNKRNSKIYSKICHEAHSRSIKIFSPKAFASDNTFTNLKWKLHHLSPLWIEKSAALL